MKIVVVGLGSMGRRRIRLLKKIDSELEIVGVDSKGERCEQSEREFGIRTTNDLDVVLDEFKPECVIVSTSPLTHSSIITKALKAGCNVFTELNLTTVGYEENLKLANERNKILFLSSTFLYREEIQYIKNKIGQYNGTLNYIYHAGQYLPDWHPWETIDNFFVSDKRTNGCRELFAIELPWIVKTFGQIRKVEVLSKKSTNLPIDYHDTYQVLVEHENGNFGMIAVDVVSRRAVRKLEVYGENLYLTWDGTPTTLMEYDYVQKKETMIELYTDVNRQEGYASFIIENAYENELRTFFDVIKGTDVEKYSFKDDIEIIDIINTIEGI